MAVSRKFYDKHKKGLHIEAEGCIVNIREKLTDRKGRAVTSISIKPDNFAGELPWKVIPKIYNIRVVQLKSERR